MNDRRTSSLCAASKMGFVLKFDPSGSGNRCYYRCLATFLNQNEDDVINSVEKFMLNKQFIPVENEVSIQIFFRVLRSKANFMLLPNVYCYYIKSAFFISQHGNIVETDLHSFFSETDFPSLGERPNSWQDTVKALRNEMATHAVITVSALAFDLHVTIIDWEGVSNLKAIAIFTGQKIFICIIYYTHIIYTYNIF